MSGKHDKSVDPDFSTNYLMTGPIVIRGLGRGMKDAFRSSRSSRHRAPLVDSDRAAEQVGNGGGGAPPVRQHHTDDEAVTEATDRTPDGGSVRADFEIPTDDADPRQDTAVSPGAPPASEQSESGPIEWFEQRELVEQHAPDHEQVMEPLEVSEPTIESERVTDAAPSTEPIAEPTSHLIAAAPSVSESDQAEPDQIATDRLEVDPVPTEAAVLSAAALPAAAVPVDRTGKPPAPPRPPRRPATSERVGREAVGLVVLVVLALICAGLITAVVIKTRDDAAVAAREAANYTPPPLSNPTPESTGPVVAVIGDAGVSQAASGVSADQRWTSVLESALGGQVSTIASAGMGYAAKDGSGQTFVQAAAKVPANADVVVFFGGAADSQVSALSVAKAVTDAISAATRQAPEAKIVVVGPAFSAGMSSADLTALRHRERNAATIAKATWVDPFEEQWLSSSARSAESASALSASDEKALATKVQAVVEKAVG